MIKKKTTFILGAGASVPYEYLVGEQLIQDIVDDMGDSIGNIYDEQRI